MKMLLAFSLILSASVVHAEGDPEITYLLTTVESSGCTFIRNGDDHASADAADHLRMKYKRAGKRIGSAEDFIKRIASKSFLSGKPYTIQCEGDEPEPTGEWLSEQLAEFRSASQG
ncbi:MAG: DUF5329 family protein [Gammaproteobacteria bacterium]